jgi:hypothetical protein
MGVAVATSQRARFFLFLRDLAQAFVGCLAALGRHKQNIPMV